MANNTYLFSGQGAQYPGMGKELCLDSQVAARIARLRGTLMQQAVPQGDEVVLQTVRDILARIPVLTQPLCCSALEGEHR